MLNCPNVELAVALSLRQISSEEERAYRAHLATCVTCRLKLAEIRETLELLPLTLPPAPVPPDLKARVVSAVRREVSASARSQEAKRRWALPLSAGVAAIALVVGAYSLLQVSGLQERFTGFEQAAPVERRVTLTGTPEAPAASGRVMVARVGGGTRITLQAQGLPPLRPGEAYQLWLIKDGIRTNGGVFVVDATGKGGVATWLPDPVEFDALGITREPDALGQEPRGTKVMGSATGA